MSTQRVLIYSPDVAGHPRVYCRVIADALAGAPCELVVAMGFTEAVGLQHSPDVQPLTAREGVQLVDTRQHSDAGVPHLRAEELVRLQQHFGIETTLFIEADKSAAEFRRIAAGAAPRLHGRNLGIFANAAEWYPGEDSFSGMRRSLVAPTLRTTLGNIKRAIFERRATSRYFYEKEILGKRVLDEILVKDERLADWFGPPVYWMPEISRPVPAPESEDDRQAHACWEAELQAFLAGSGGREPMLYFGDAAYYKGYDLFLAFIAANPDTCAIHAGQSYRQSELPSFEHDVEALRAQLKREGRLYETNAYVHTQRLKELYFGAVRLYVTTHRLALSSSTMIQALELGKPVLMPDRGLIGHRIRANDLGDVYEYGNLEDLAGRARKLWQGDLKRFEAPTRAFWQRFSDESVREFFVQRLLAPQTAAG